MRSRNALLSTSVLILAMGLGAVAGARAQAPMAVPGSPNPAVVQGGAYAVEPAHTRIQFSVDHLGFSTWYGDFAGASGTLVLDPKAPATSRLSVTIPTASVSTTNATLDGELKSADWFDAAKYPTITFVSTMVTPTGKSTAQVAGDLTFHGVTRPVVLQARFHGAGTNPLSKAYTAGFDVTGKIRRSDFGVTKYVPIVGDEVNLVISGAFERKAS